MEGSLSLGIDTWYRQEFARESSMVEGRPLEAGNAELESELIDYR